MALKAHNPGLENLKPYRDSNRTNIMANKTIDDLVAQVEKSKTVEKSATLLIGGIAARMQAAVDAAIAGGVSAADMAPVQAEIDSLGASSDDLATAVSANTLAAP